MSTTVTMPAMQTTMASSVARSARTPITSPWTEMAPSPWRMSDVRLICERPPRRGPRGSGIAVKGIRALMMADG